MMQAAGGVDWMVAMAAKVIESRPKQITLIAPLTAFLFSIGAGTSNIIYPLLPVIYDVSYKNGIRPSRPLTVTVVQSGIALAASPVSAAMAAMLTLTDIAPYNLGLTEILAITIPSCVIGIVVTSLVTNRMWKELDDDPEVQARIASGELASRHAPVAAVATGSGSAGDSQPAADQAVSAGDNEAGPALPQLTYTTQGRNSAMVFFAGVLAIVFFGLFPDLRPAFEVEGEGSVPIDMTTTIVLVMFVVGAVILYVGRPDVSSGARPVRVQGRHDLRDRALRNRLADGHLHRGARGLHRRHHRRVGHELGVPLRPGRVPRGRPDHEPVHGDADHRAHRARRRPPPGIVTGMWAGALGGVYTLPANGTQIAAANFDLSGTTKLGTKLIDHSFFIPMLVLSVTTIAVGAVIGGVFF